MHRFVAIFQLLHFYKGDAYKQFLQLSIISAILGATKGATKGATLRRGATGATKCGTSMTNLDFGILDLVISRSLETVARYAPPLCHPSSKLLFS